MRWKLDAWYERWVVRRARDLIVTSRYAQRELQLFTRARFHEIENPVPDEFFDVPVLTRDSGNAPRLLCPATVCPRKDIITLLRAFALVQSQCAGTKLEIAGNTDSDPDYVAAYEVERLGLRSSVSFSGNLHGPSLLDRYSRASIVVLSSRQETAPLAISEAMAAARPVVATTVGGVADMVAEGSTGLLVPPGDPTKLAGAIIRLLASSEDRVAYGRAARLAAEGRFRLSAILNRTLALYSDVLRAHCDVPPGNGQE
jgi:glycosyltransferase involved in cell wall biosynthesis